jgi:ubiquitin C-terminal hydrolase
LFDNDDHHDAHEFLMWLLNTIHEEIIGGLPEKPKEPAKSLVTEVFEGRLVS